MLGSYLDGQSTQVYLYAYICCNVNFFALKIFLLTVLAANIICSDLDKQIIISKSKIRLIFP
jgi:hypothetical protein